MEAIFQRIEKVISPSSDTKILKISDKDNYIKATDIIAKAEIKAASLIQDAEDIYLKRKEEGYNQGLAEAKLEHAEKIMDTVFSSLQFIENVEETIVDVVMSSIRKILNSYEKEELAAEVVIKALNHIRAQQRVLIRVNPDDEIAVKKALASMISENGKGFIDVIADVRLERTSCILESDLGIVDASLEVQLMALEKAFKSKISK